VGVVVALFVLRHRLAIFSPAGVVASKERSLMIFTLLLSLVVVVPVFIMTFAIAWKYRASNAKTKTAYRPDWDHSRLAELAWWGLPCVIIVVLAVVTWIGTHNLDPYKPLASSNPPITIQVVALQWKWLFIYPQQHIATVNYVEFPAGTPVDFQITSDAPMNSFWIPKLGGQVYAMSGMTTHLNLMADQAGSYSGSSANLSGKGFAGMTFTATSTGSQADFAAWVANVQHSSNNLDQTAYNTLAQPSENQPASYYASTDPQLYDTILMKYMGSHQ
jgi:cytochrome o ubiquinol oxidase subunit 2